MLYNVLLGDVALHFDVLLFASYELALVSTFDTLRVRRETERDVERQEKPTHRAQGRKGASKPQEEPLG